MNLGLHNLPDLIGMLGVFLMIWSFLLLQTQKTTPDSFFYLYCNFVGALMLLVSLYYNWNTSSVIIQIIWATISVYGIIKVKVNKRKQNLLADDLELENEISVENNPQTDTES